MIIVPESVRGIYFNGKKRKGLVQCRIGWRSGILELVHAFSFFLLSFRSFQYYGCEADVKKKVGPQKSKQTRREIPLSLFPFNTFFFKRDVVKPGFHVELSTRMPRKRKDGIVETAVNIVTLLHNCIESVISTSRAQPLFLSFTCQIGFGCA